MSDRLETLHHRIEELTDPDGEFAVVCPRSGKRPVPVRGKSFPSPGVAAEAVDLVIEYRKLLREVDPHLENVPIVACANSADPLSLTAAEERTTTGSRSRERDRSRDRESEQDRAPDRERRREREPGRTGEHDRTRRDDRTHGDAGGRASARDPAETVTLSGDGDGEWLRVTDAPVVRVREDGDPLDDAVIGLALNAKL